MPIPGPQAQARLGRYELLARLATGGMGEIFLARLSGAEGFQKLYVVKRILAHLADDARFRQMLVAEAQIAAKMSHPNICQVFELGETDGQLYIVMEYLEGVSLLPLLRRFSKENTALDLGFVAGVLQQVTDAMNYAHDLKERDGDFLGIIHRDVTPSNIFLTETGVAKVLDFGIAKARGASTQTQEGTVKGKYAYMAPEQLKGNSIDRRVDIFALGVVLYEMLALRRLFQRKTDYLTFRAVMEQPIPDIRRYRPDLPDAVADALTRALERDPNNRYETARQLGTALLDGMQGTRPWTQGEISDFVRHYFAEEIGKRSQQVASVVARTQSGVASSRATMPLLIHPDEGMHEGDGEDDFPSVETEVESAPLWMPRPKPPNAGASSDFAGSSTSGTPQPFGIESTGSAPSLQPIRGQQPTPGPNQVVVVPRRSVFWPIFGVLMVVIAGGALFLVWQQMQKQQTPAEIKITQESAAKPNEEPVETHTIDSQPQDQGSSEVPPPAGSGSSTAGPGSGERKPPKPKSFAEQINAAMAARKPELLSCINSHPDGIPKGKAIEASISFDAKGHTTSVSLSPADVNASPLGMCLKNAVKKAAFPNGRETSFSVPLTPKGA
ncbi:MAG TPA: protein kinase [Kofleriaceae bacterium]|nr:protein kinase [Kofleriaceae bacterium]